MLESIKTWKNLDSSGLDFIPWGIKFVRWLTNLNKQSRLISAFSFVNRPCLKIQQRVWVCTEYTKANNAQERHTMMANLLGNHACQRKQNDIKLLL